ncbi:alpha/beta hydrolase [Rufibacter sp. LB8]|uniref:alpha/beta hydrolase n=1 Tax=Rufibacter sp. LB8 TaxID=2777781 RepID=UPI00178C6F43|nr:alpha/beta hydrolase [Rufibacter sp. LB8]
MNYLFALLCFLSALTCLGQQPTPAADSLRRHYTQDMKAVSQVFEQQFYPNRPAIYALSEGPFLAKIDSLKQPFLSILQKYSSPFQALNAAFIPTEQRDIGYFFDAIILNYPYFHENHTHKKVRLSAATQARLDQHLKEFNNPALLTSQDFRGYVQAFLRHQSSEEVKKPIYKKSDNKRLDAYLALVPTYFTNQACRDYWQYHYLRAHLEDWGSKNIGPAIKSFVATSQNATHTRTIDSLYTESANSYQGHVIKTYKTVDGHALDLHLFLPDSTYKNAKRPVMVFFSGGSWTQGTPEWNFYNAAAYARKGWVAVAVEYRIADRHETTPFEAVKDAKSAIRWLRMHAAAYNLDPNRIVASGNSAGGHLVLGAALAENINERTDDLRISSVPNLLLVNAGVYNMQADGSTSWISKGLKDKNDVQKISPQHLLKKGLPPMLLLHGTHDQSVEYQTAKMFAQAMQQLGNDVEFHTLQGAPHAIWWDRRFSGKVATLRTEFLKKHGYE